MSVLLDHALPAAAFAGAVAVGVTVAVERFGGRIGGLLGTLPTTIVPASLGLWAQADSPDVFAQAMDAAPGGMVVNAVFLLLWRVLPPRLLARLRLGPLLALMTLLSLGAWLALAVPVVALGRAWAAAGHDTLALGLAGAATLLVLGVLGCLRAPPTPRGHRPVGPVTLALRGLFAATAIGLAVALAELAGPIAAGVASVFPAMFLTTMASLWLSQGHAVPSGAVGPMMLGSTSVAAYALLARALVPALGPVAGAALAWTLAVALTTVPAWRWLEHRARRAAESAV